MKRSVEDGDVADNLDRVDWNFPRATTPVTTVHSLHWFPGNFIPQIPAFLIQLLSRKGDLVCDRFCGSGTTGIEAVRLGRQSWQSDINRASIQVARGKLAAFTSVRAVRELSSVSNELMLDFTVDTTREPRTRFGLNPDLKPWLDSHTTAQLRYIWDIVESSPDDRRGILEMIFTDTLFACASVAGAKTRSGKRRRHHWGWVADNVRPRNLVRHDAVDFFRIRLARAIRVLDSERANAIGTNSVVREDARKLTLSDESVGANRLTYAWMNWPLDEDLSMEIGARHFRRRPRALDDYLDSMRMACGEMFRVLKPHGYCAIVIGASRKYPEAAMKVVSILAGHLTKVWGPTPRIPTRRRVSEREGTTPTEFITVFKK